MVGEPDTLHLSQATQISNTLDSSGVAMSTRRAMSVLYYLIINHSSTGTELHINIRPMARPFITGGGGLHGYGHERRRQFIHSRPKYSRPTWPDYNHVVLL